MPVFTNGTWFYWASFTSDRGTQAGFDINQSGYGETVAALENTRAIPWAQNGYQIVSQAVGLQPYRRTYQATVYSEQDYNALRGCVGQRGHLLTTREGVGGLSGNPTRAILTGLRRGSYQYPAFPHAGDGFRDLQTIILDFVMLE